MAGSGRTGSRARPVSGGSSAAIGLCETEAPAGRDSKPKEKKRAASPGFVELITAQPAAAECVIEFESKSGGKTRIQWKGSGAPEWGGLLRAWREAER